MTRKMIKIAVIAAMGMAAAQPAQACWNDAQQDAARIKHLNMMLMVTGLRCRNGSDNFLPDYNRFVSNNNAVLGAQNALIRSHLAQKHGAKRAVSALDEMSIGMANKYGNGHSSMGCKELKALAKKLSREPMTTSKIALVADEVVGLPALSGGSCAVKIAARK
jgi:hypothetical protein